MEPGRAQAPFFGAPVNNFYLLLAFVTGAGVAAQSVINARLRCKDHGFPFSEGRHGVVNDICDGGRRWFSRYQPNYVHGSTTTIVADVVPSASEPMGKFKDRKSVV